MGLQDFLFSFISNKISQDYPFSFSEIVFPEKDYLFAYDRINIFNAILESEIVGRSVDIKVANLINKNLYAIKRQNNEIGLIINRQVFGEKKKFAQLSLLQNDYVHGRRKFVFNNGLITNDNSIFSIKSIIKNGLVDDYSVNAIKQIEKYGLIIDDNGITGIKSLINYGLIIDPLTTSSLIIDNNYGIITEDEFLTAIKDLVKYGQFYDYGIYTIKNLVKYGQFYNHEVYAIKVLEKFAQIFDEFDDIGILNIPALIIEPDIFATKLTNYESMIFDIITGSRDSLINIKNGIIPINDTMSVRQKLSQSGFVHNIESSFAKRLIEYKGIIDLSIFLSDRNVSISSIISDDIIAIKEKERNGILEDNDIMSFRNRLYNELFTVNLINNDFLAKRIVKLFGLIEEDKYFPIKTEHKAIVDTSIQYVNKIISHLGLINEELNNLARKIFEGLIMDNDIFAERVKTKKSIVINSNIEFATFIEKMAILIDLVSVSSALQRTGVIVSNDGIFMASHDKNIYNTILDDVLLLGKWLEQGQIEPTIWFAMLQDNDLLATISKNLNATLYDDIISYRQNKHSSLITADIIKSIKNNTKNAIQQIEISILGKKFNMKNSILFEGTNELGLRQRERLSQIQEIQELALRENKRDSLIDLNTVLGVRPRAKHGTLSEFANSFINAKRVIDYGGLIVKDIFASRIKTKKAILHFENYLALWKSIWFKPDPPDDDIDNLIDIDITDPGADDPVVIPDTPDPYHPLDPDSDDPYNLGNEGDTDNGQEFEDGVIIYPPYDNFPDLPWYDVPTVGIDVDQMICVSFITNLITLWNNFSSLYAGFDCRQAIGHILQVYQKAINENEDLNANPDVAIMWKQMWNLAKWHGIAVVNSHCPAKLIREWYSYFEDHEDLICDVGGKGDAQWESDPAGFYIIHNHDKPNMPKWAVQRSREGSGPVSRWFEITNKYPGKMSFSLSITAAEADGVIIPWPEPTPVIRYNITEFPDDAITNLGGWEEVGNYIKSLISGKFKASFDLPDVRTIVGPGTSRVSFDYFTERKWIDSFEKLIFHDDYHDFRVKLRHDGVWFIRADHVGTPQEWAVLTTYSSGMAWFNVHLEHDGYIIIRYENCADGNGDFYAYDNGHLIDADYNGGEPNVRNWQVKTINLSAGDHLIEFEFVGSGLFSLGGIDVYEEIPSHWLPQGSLTVKINNKVFDFGPTNGSWTTIELPEQINHGLQSIEFIYNEAEDDPSNEKSEIRVDNIIVTQDVPYNPPPPLQNAVLNFYINDVLKGSWVGERPWMHTGNFLVPPTRNKYTWEFIPGTDVREETINEEWSEDGTGLTGFGVGKPGGWVVEDFNYIDVIVNRYNPGPISIYIDDSTEPIFSGGNSTTIEVRITKQQLIDMGITSFRYLVIMDDMSWNDLGITTTKTNKTVFVEYVPETQRAMIDNIQVHRVDLLGTRVDGSCPLFTGNECIDDLVNRLTKECKEHGTPGGKSHKGKRHIWLFT